MLQTMESRGAPALREDRRRVHRSRAVLMMARLEVELADGLCLVCDISAMGARLKSPQPMAVGDVIRLDFGDVLEVAGTVRWTAAGYSGIAFAHPVDLAPLFDRSGRGTADRARAIFRGSMRARRGHPRLRRRAHLVLHHGKTAMAAELHDLSPMGARIDLENTQDFAIGDQIRFSIDDRFDCEGSVRWISRSAIGLAFDPPLRMWKLEKWLLEGSPRREPLAVDGCSAPTLARVLGRGVVDGAAGAGEPGSRQEGA